MFMGAFCWDKILDRITTRWNNWWREQISLRQLISKNTKTLVNLCVKQDHLKAILRDMCDLHREGEHIHQYSLKKLYGETWRNEMSSGSLQKWTHKTCTTLSERDTTRRREEYQDESHALVDRSRVRTKRTKNVLQPWPCMIARLNCIVELCIPGCFSSLKILRKFTFYFIPVRKISFLRCWYPQTKLLKCKRSIFTTHLSCTHPSRAR